MTRPNFKYYQIIYTEQQKKRPAYIPYNGYFLRLEIFAIWAPKRSLLIFAFLIFAIRFNRKKWLIDNYFYT